MGHQGLTGRGSFMVQMIGGEIRSSALIHGGLILRFYHSVLGLCFSHDDWTSALFL